MYSIFKSTGGRYHFKISNFFTSVQQLESESVFHPLKNCANNLGQRLGD